jgi:DNA-binding HxlR family transcriptional regulator
MESVTKPDETKCSTTPNNTDTPLHRLLGVLAGPWTIFLIWVLASDGPMRFGVLHRRIEGISTKMLTERLRLLEEEGFVTRHYEPTVPPQVTYTPTQRINELLPVLKMLCSLSRKWYSSEIQPARKVAGR